MDVKVGFPCDSYLSRDSHSNIYFPKSIIIRKIDKELSPLRPCLERVHLYFILTEIFGSKNP